MPSQLFFTLFIEFFLVFLTGILFHRPKLIFGVWSDKYKVYLITGGVIFLCITFCWSFLLGSYIALSHMV